MATNNLKEHETEIANAIRAKKGTTALINPQDFASEIRNLPSGQAETGRIGSLTLDDGDYLSVRNVQSGYRYTLYIFDMRANDNGLFTIYDRQGPLGTTIPVGSSDNIKLAMFLANYGDGTIVIGTDNDGGGYGYVQDFEGIMWSAVSSGNVVGGGEYWAFN